MRVRKVAGAAVRAGLWVVAVAALAPSVAAANDDERAARILYFEPLRALPAAGRQLASARAGSALQQLRFDAFGRRFDISLGSNGRLMASKPQNSQLELYRGSIDGIAGSWVRLATKGDVLHGMMWDGTQLYAIEPAAEVRDALAQPLPADASQTIVFRLADVTMDQGAAACALRKRADQGERCVRCARDRAEERNGGDAGEPARRAGSTSRRSATRVSASATAASRTRATRS